VISEGPPGGSPPIELGGGGGRLEIIVKEWGLLGGALST
jgi:hypothetical protein